MTRTLSPEGYTIATMVKEQYGRWLLAKQWSKPEVRAHYDDVRLRLLMTIVETTPHGYRVADAKFLAAQILLERGRTDEALRLWRTMAPVPGDAYFRAYSEILDVVLDRAPDAPAIQRVLAREYGRWRVHSIDRLREFGHWCDTF